MDVWMYVCMHVCMHVYMYVCMHACMYACVYISLSIYLFIYPSIYIAWTKVLDLLTRHGKPSFLGRRLKRKRNFRTARTDVSNSSNHDFRPRACARCRFFQPWAPTRPGIFEQFERLFCEKPWRKAHFRTPTPFGFYNIKRHGSRGGVRPRPPPSYQSIEHTPQALPTLYRAPRA